MHIVAKVETVLGCLGSLMEKSDRVGKLQDNLRRVQLAIAELTPELDVETFSVSHTDHRQSDQLRETKGVLYTNKMCVPLF
jgi:hypothetical protein